MAGCQIPPHAAQPPLHLEAARALTQQCSTACKGDSRAAVRMLKEQWHSAPVSRPDVLTKRWGKRSTVTAARPANSVPPLAAQAAELLKAGWTDEHGAARG
jgi:hypothetical protein